MLSAKFAISMLLSGEKISADEFSQLWESDHQGFRSKISEWITESVERDGSTNGTAWPEVLRDYLSTAGLRALFLDVRKHAARLEPEWRQSFVTDFDTDDTILPQYDIGHGLMYYSLLLLQAFSAQEDESAVLLVNEGIVRGIPMSDIYYSAKELNEVGIFVSHHIEQLTAGEVATSQGMPKAAQALLSRQ